LTTRDRPRHLRDLVTGTPRAAMDSPGLHPGAVPLWSIIREFRWPPSLPLAPHEGQPRLERSWRRRRQPLRRRAVGPRLDGCSGGWRPGGRESRHEEECRDRGRQFNERLAAIARALLHEPNVQATLQRTVTDAARTQDREVYASVSLVLQRRQVETPVYSDERAPWADRLPYELGRGRAWTRSGGRNTARPS
jgi:hypothetical protein